MPNQLDFLSVGDITTDAFIRLQEASVHCNINQENCELCVKFADKIPYEFVEVIRAVGNAPNAAVSAARLGLNTGLVTNMGNDLNGSECLAVLKKEKINIRYAKVHKNTKTNYHYVLWYESERTILIKHEPYEYRLPEISPAPRWLYLSSFRGTPEYHAEIATYLEKHKEVKLAFQPGKFEINLGATKLANFYKRAEVFVCNKEEAEKILGTGNDNSNDNDDNNHNDVDIKKLLVGIRNLGPKQVVITDGPKGAYYYDGKDCYFMPPYPDPKPPYERTGAGDAYASTFTAALALGRTAEEALQWSGVNSMSVVQKIGAQRGLLHQKDFEKYLAKAPDNYKLQKIKTMPPNELRRQQYENGIQERMGVREQQLLQLKNRQRLVFSELSALAQSQENISIELAQNVDRNMPTAKHSRAEVCAQAQKLLLELQEKWREEAVEEMGTLLGTLEMKLQSLRQAIKGENGKS